MSERSCRQCGWKLVYVHGHGQCVNFKCPEKGKNQDECCTGEVKRG